MSIVVCCNHWRITVSNRWGNPGRLIQTVVYSQSWDSIYRQHLIFLWGCHNFKSFWATGCLHWCHLTPLCPYMGRMHIWQTIFLCVSSRWLKWKPADVKGMRLKDDIIISNQSLPLSLSLSPPCSAVIIYSPSHSSRKGTVTFVNFHHCELVYTLCVLQPWPDKLLWLAQQTQPGEPRWRKK